jgi:hypothetical protein
MNRIKLIFTLAHSYSMVIYDFYLLRNGTSPSETNPPLVIDPDAVLPRPVTRQGLQPVARRGE